MSNSTFVQKKKKFHLKYCLWHTILSIQFVIYVILSVQIKCTYSRSYHLHPFNVCLNVECRLHLYTFTSQGASSYLLCLTFNCTLIIMIIIKAMTTNAMRSATVELFTFVLTTFIFFPPFSLHRILLLLLLLLWLLQIFIMAIFIACYTRCHNVVHAVRYSWAQH